MSLSDLPQAFVLMVEAEAALKLVKADAKPGLFFKGKRIRCSIIANDFGKTPVSTETTLLLPFIEEIINTPCIFIKKVPLLMNTE